MVISYLDIWRVGLFVSTCGRTHLRGVCTYQTPIPQLQSGMYERAVVCCQLSAKQAPLCTHTRCSLWLGATDHTEGHVTTINHIPLNRSTGCLGWQTSPGGGGGQRRVAFTRDRHQRWEPAKERTRLPPRISTTDMQRKKRNRMESVTENSRWRWGVLFVLLSEKKKNTRKGGVSMYASVCDSTSFTERSTANTFKLLCACHLV